MIQHTSAIDVMRISAFLNIRADERGIWFMRFECLDHGEKTTVLTDKRERLVFWIKGACESTCTFNAIVWFYSNN